jgi:DNA repair protein RadC
MGASASDHYLLEVLIGRKASVVFDAKLSEVLDADDSKLATIGFSPSARRRILACAELARRYQPRVSLPEPVTRPAQAVAYFGELRVCQRETLDVLLLDARYGVIGIELIAVGSVAHVSVEPREVFAPAVAAFASAIVIAHNHPSGDARPSPQDVEFTRTMVEAGRVLNIEVLDHLVVTRRSYYSFNQAGRL